MFRRTKTGKPILAVNPIYNEDRESSDARLAQQEAFTQAAAYAQGVQYEELYVQLAKGTDPSGYNMALADRMGKPEIVHIDASTWNGQSGQTITIKAKDDTKVFTVGVVIHDHTGVLEQGQAVPTSIDGIWTYTTTASVSAGPTVVMDVSAQDLPGNIGVASIHLNEDHRQNPFRIIRLDQNPPRVVLLPGEGFSLLGGGSIGIECTAISHQIQCSKDGLPGRRTFSCTIDPGFLHTCRFLSRHLTRT